MAPQGEKSSIMSTTGRNNDLTARKASYETAHKMEKKMDCWGGSTQKSSNNGQQQQQQKDQYGSWGPMFKNKSNFAEMHWC